MRRVLARLSAAALASTALVSAPALADPLPTGGEVVAGSATIGATGTAMTVTQGSDRAIINWGGFSIGAGHSVTFVQPDAQSAVLNRVTGSTTSEIAGALTGNGQVYLVNPNGIAITPTGTVAVGSGFVASTLDIADEDFLKGDLTFRGNGASGEVRNAGIVTVGRGGYAALIGGTVRNDGLIAAPLGKVGLGFGERATLDLAGDGFLQVALPTAKGAEGDGALVENSGKISAEGGLVVMTAATAREAARRAVNLSGVVEARSVGGRNGAIVLGGGAGGSVRVTGKARARGETEVASVAVPQAKPALPRGGTIDITGRDITLAGAELDASGAGGGGTIRVGGDWQGRGSLQTAETATVDAGSLLRADATVAGTGGTMVVWSDGRTLFEGRASARGAGAGTSAGTGGNVEVSGKAVLDYRGHTDLSGPAGFGTLLLDPYNITISDGPAHNSSGLTATGNDSVISVSTLVSALNSANVVLTTGGTGSPGAQVGDITVASPIVWSGTTSLTLLAHRHITVNAPISAPNGWVTLRADASGLGTGDVLFGNGATVTAQSLGIFYNAANYALPKDFSPLIGGGTPHAAYMLVNTATQLQAIGNNLGGLYALGRDIDASETVNWNGGSGFMPIALTGSFEGVLEGNGHVISGLTIVRGSDYVGLFSRVGTSGQVRNFTLLGGSVAGYADDVGVVAGLNHGLVTDITFEGVSIIGRTRVGGLVDHNRGRVFRSVVDATISGTNDIGGIVGMNDVGGFVAGVTFGGSVTGTGRGAGGIAGTTADRMQDLAVTGRVTGAGTVGGIAGWAVGSGSGRIVRAYVSGQVTGNGFQTGAVIGWSSMSTEHVYWDTDTAGQSVAVGEQGSIFDFNGDVTDINGRTSAQLRQRSTYAGWDFTGAFYHNGFMPMRPVGIWEAGKRGVDGVRRVRTAREMLLAGMFVRDSHRLVNDIAMPNPATTAAADIWGPIGWIPIGDDSVDSRFQGRFDGNGFRIVNLTINGSGFGGIGLFGAIGSSGVVENMTLVGGSVTGTVNGALAGINHGRIANSRSSTAVFGSSQVGGLVGSNFGTISGSSSSGTVTASGGLGVGGLVGVMHAGSLIEDSHASGTVAGNIPGSNGVGGLVGDMIGGTITGSYATGSVTGNSFVGGLVGQIGSQPSVVTQVHATGFVIAQGEHVGGLIGSADRLTLSRAYALGDVSNGSSLSIGGLIGRLLTGSVDQTYATGRVFGSGSEVGGLIGRIGVDTSLLTVTSSYWDRDTTGRDISALGEGRTTAELRNPATYAGWDFATDWYRGGDMRPIGRWEAARPGVEGIATITNLHQLALVNTNLSGAYRLGANIDASATGGADAYGIWGAAGFVPIGTSANPFVGHFDGADRRIDRLTVNSLANPAGLFGAIGGNGLVERVGLTSVQVTGNVEVGGLVGAIESSGATVRDVFVTGYVSGLRSVGGIVGYNSGGLIERVAMRGGVNATQREVGGLVGVNWQGALRQSYAVTTIGGGAIQAGGLVGLGFGEGVQTSFWDTQISGLAAGVGEGSAGGGIGLTTAQMQDTATFMTLATGWDFDTVWAPPSAGHYAEFYAYAPVIRVHASGSMVYGDAVPALTTTIHGGPNRFADAPAGDTVSLSPVVTTTAGARPDFGFYAASGTQGTVTSAGGTGYRIVYTGGLTVARRQVTVTADNLSRFYGDANPTLSITLGGAGLVSGDNFTGLLDTTADARSGIGHYAITQGTLALSPNYELTFVGGTLNVRPRPITVTAQNQSVVYGNAAPLLTYTVGGRGLVNGDSLVGTLVSSVTATSPVGGYAIAQGTLLNANYNITFVSGTVQVTRRAITVTADDLSRIYGDANPALTWTVGGLGLVNGDTLTGSLETAADAASGVGQYAITRGTLAASTNYEVTFTSGTLDVTRRAITVTANDQSRIYGDANPALTWTVGGLGLVNGDTLTGSLETAADAASGVGQYAITRGTLAASTNYQMTFAGGTLDVTRRAITVTAHDHSRLFGQDNPALTWTVGGLGLVNGDRLTGSLETAADRLSLEGSYAITQGSVTDANNANYAITFTPGLLRVTRVFAQPQAGQIVPPSSGPAARVPGRPGGTPQTVVGGPDGDPGSGAPSGGTLLSVSSSSGNPARCGPSLACGAN